MDLGFVGFMLKLLYIIVGVVFVGVWLINLFSCWKNNIVCVFGGIYSRIINRCLFGFIL